MITEPVDVLEQWRGRPARLVADNVYVSASPIAEAAFVYTPAIRFEIKPHAPKTGFVPPKGLFGRRSNGRITRKPPTPSTAEVPAKAFSLLTEITYCNNIYHR